MVLLICFYHYKPRIHIPVLPIMWKIMQRETI